MLISLAVGGIGICVIPFCTDLWSSLCAVSMFSVGSAGFYTILNVILIDQFGKNNLASSWGFITMTQGILCLAYSPLLGKLILMGSQENGNNVILLINN